MAKNQTVFVCSNCGEESPKWFGKCQAVIHGIHVMKNK